MAIQSEKNIYADIITKFVKKKDIVSPELIGCCGLPSSLLGFLLYHHIFNDTALNNSTKKCC